MSGAASAAPFAHPFILSEANQFAKRIDLLVEGSRVCVQQIIP